MACKVKLVSATQVEQEYVDHLAKEMVDAGFDGKDVTKFLIAIGKPEGLMTYVARVSSPNQTNPNYAGLLKYCMEHGHWSVFEQVDCTFEIQTSRGIAPQILRHRSFSFQEFSQRYAAVGEDGIIIYAARRQDKKNRQNSIDDMPEEIKAEWEARQLSNWKTAFEHYTWALNNEIAKEQARFVLPLGTKTKLYMKGSVRSWIHYIQVRADPSTQKEHQEIALAIKEQLTKKFPIVGEALDITC
jgi:thymidylate synthase (FAD)